MSIDQCGRAAGAALRELTHDVVDVESSLDALVGRARRQRDLRVIAAIVALIAIAGGASWAVRSMAADSVVAPTTTPTDTTSNQSLPTCANPVFTCHRTQITTHLTAAMTWTMTPAFSRDLHYVSDSAADAPLLVESYWRNDTVPTGVTVAENAVAALPGPSGDPAPDVTAGARSIATWLSQRPYLQTSAVRRTTVGGMTGWTLQVQTNSKARQLYPCNKGLIRCTPLVVSGIDVRWVVGVWPTMTSRFTFVDVPGAGTAMVWSWTQGSVTRLDTNQALIDTIHFG